MIEAYEATQDDEYLREARTAADSLIGLGFRMGYQTNTTGFGAEAMLRLAHITSDDTYLGIADVCVANLIDNVWLWQPNYGHGTERRMFFGMFPLHDAPYLAAYEEAEMVAKVHDYLNIGRDELRPAVRLLLSEWVKFAGDRLWAYLPANQPAKAVASKARVGRVTREIAVPVEDLPDGWEEAGHVGQEVYGAGMAFVATTRHFRPLPGTGALLYCDYPVFDLHTQKRGASGSVRFTVAGDRRTVAALRIIPRDPAQSMPEVRLEGGGSRRGIRPEITAQGHQRFEVPGGQSVRLAWSAKVGPPKASQRRDIR